jgi:hypothetical protein
LRGFRASEGRNVGFRGKFACFFIEMLKFPEKMTNFRLTAMIAAGNINVVFRPCGLRMGPGWARSRPSASSNYGGLEPFFEGAYKWQSR